MREDERAKAERIYSAAFIRVRAEISQAKPQVQEGLASRSCIFNHDVEHPLGIKYRSALFGSREKFP